MILLSTAFGHVIAQTPAIDPLDHQFTYSIIDTGGDLSELVTGIQNNAVPSLRLSGAVPFALWTPVEKPDDAPFAGLAPNQVILMLAWNRPVTDLLESLHILLSTVPGVSTVTTKVTTKVFIPLYLTNGLNVPSGAGFYVHRDELYRPESVDEVFRLSREAWVTFEPAFGVKVVGLFREFPEQDGIARLNRIFWYPDYQGWEDSRNFSIDPESQRRFQERRQYQVEGSGIAFATDRLPIQ